MLRLHRYNRQHQSKFYSDREVPATGILAKSPAHLRVPLLIIVCMSPCSSISISTTAQESCQVTILSMSSSATWARRKRKLKMRRKSKVREDVMMLALKCIKYSTFFFCCCWFCLAKLKKVKKKKKRGEEFLDEECPYITKVFAKFSHDAPLPMVKKKHLTVEQLNARRRKVWLTIAKKEIPKVSV